MPKIVQLIYDTERRGSGSKGDPYRTVPRLHTLDGRLVAELDAAAPVEPPNLEYHTEERAIVTHAIRALEDS